MNFIQLQPWWRLELTLCWCDSKWAKHQINPLLQAKDCPFTSHTCKWANVTMPTATVICLCFRRYMAIIHPLQQRMSSKETKVVVGVIWVLALFLAFPQYHYSNTYQLPDRMVCYIDWPENTVIDFKKMWVPPRGSFSDTHESIRIE